MRPIVSQDQREISQGGRTLVVGNEPDSSQIAVAIAKSLASAPRMRILDYLVTQVASLSEIARDLEMPIATASMHLSSLEQAGLLGSHTAPGKRGRQRIYSRIYDIVVLHLPRTSRYFPEDRIEIEMPVGAFSKHHAVPPCGMATEDDMIGDMDDVISFYDPSRFAAQLVWLSHGYLEYIFPNRAHGRAQAKRLELSMEICSEAAPSAADWPSDIYLEVNGQRIGEWTSPSDFGHKRGIRTPIWWVDWNTQYGLLKVWQVDDQGSYIDGVRISDVTIGALNLMDQPSISVRIGVDDQAQNRGGLNIFGGKFGNHAQDMVMKISL